MTFWVDCGRVQGKISTQLYGPSASTLTDEDRAGIAKNLAGELDKIYQRKRESNAAMMAMMSTSDQAALPVHTDALIHADGIDFYSTL